MRRIGFITGLNSEANILRPMVEGGVLRTAGLRAGAAQRCARDLVADGCDLLVSFGLAGGLAPDLRPGAVIVANSVIAPDGMSFAPHAETTQRLIRSLPAARSAPIAGSDELVADIRAKVSLRERTGADAVDMESHQIARCARELGVGFVVVRAVADSGTVQIPSSAYDAVDDEGKTRVGTVLLRLAVRPRQIVPLIRLAASSRAAHASLRRIAPIVVGRADGF